MKAPAVSVVIPTFNRLRYLRQALNSIAGQTFRDYEIIVVDDASTDGTAAWLRGRRAISLLRLRRNRGTSEARNRALKAARGEFIAFLDSDDYWRPNYLRTLLPAFLSSAVMVATSNYATIDARGRRLRTRTVDPERTIDQAMRLTSGLGFAPLPSASIVRRSVFAKIGVFDPRIRLNDEDLDLWYRIGQKFGPGAFAFIDRSLAAYRRHPGQITSFQDRSSHPSLLSPDWKTLTQVDKDNAVDFIYFTRKHRALLERCRRSA